jgi:hypothetical protein
MTTEAATTSVEPIQAEAPAYSYEELVKYEREAGERYSSYRALCFSNVESIVQSIQERLGCEAQQLTFSTSTDLDSDGWLEFKTTLHLVNNSIVTQWRIMRDRDLWRVIHAPSKSVFYKDPAEAMILGMIRAIHQDSRNVIETKNLKQRW